MRSNILIVPGLLRRVMFSQMGSSELLAMTQFERFGRTKVIDDEIHEMHQYENRKILPSWQNASDCYLLSGVQAERLK